MGGFDQQALGREETAVAGYEKTMMVVCLWFLEDSDGLGWFLGSDEGLMKLQWVGDFMLGVKRCSTHHTIALSSSITIVFGTHSLPIFSFLI